MSHVSRNAVVEMFPANHQVSNAYVRVDISSMLPERGALTGNWNHGLSYLAFALVLQPLG